jgi:hypothetical protein
MIEAIANDIRTGPLGDAGICFAEIRKVEDAESVLRTLGIDLEDLWWVPDVDGNDLVSLHDGLAVMRQLGGFASEITADQVARAFVAAGFLEGATDRLEGPRDKAGTVAHHTFFSRTWDEHGHNKTLSSQGQWPPNHHQEVSGGWGSHQADVSKTWPPNHKELYSLGWPPVHQATVSRDNVPPNHIGSISRNWPMDNHKQNVSRIWPPGHTASVSRAWPPGHTMQLSLATNPPPHESTVSGGWGDHSERTSLEIFPPNHDLGVSIGWNDHDRTLSKQNWPPSHRADISRTWQPGESWPPNHHAEISRTWPATPSSEITQAGTQAGR